MDAFNTYNIRDMRNDHSDNQKLCILNRKSNVDFFQDTKASINLELAKTPVTLNYADAITEFRNQVNQNFPPNISSSNNRRTRRVNEVGFRGGGRGGIFQVRGRGYYGRRGIHGRGGVHDGGLGRGGQHGRGSRNNSS